MSKLIKKSSTRFFKLLKGGYITKTKENSYYTLKLLLDAVDSGYNFVTDWYQKRKATGNFNDLLTEDLMLFLKNKANNTKIFFNNMGNSGGTASSNISPTNKPISIMRLNSENVAPQWGFNNNTLESNAVHEWTHLLNNKIVMPGLPANKAQVSPAILKVSEITGQPLVQTNKGDYLNNANETYSRLMLMRHAMKANPTVKYSLDLLKGWLKKYLLPEDETGVRLMNEVADNRIGTSNNYVPGLMSISKNGSKLIRKHASYKK